jgi:NAD(P)H-quinone oxidoreductase subunit 6
MEALSLSTAAFYFLAVLTLAGAGGVAFSRNIVYSALSLMASFLGVAGLYILLDADFVAGVQVLLYVGGVVVLTLFAVMLTQNISDVQISNRSVGTLPAVAIVVAVFAVMAKAYGAAAWRSATLPVDTTSTYAIGDALLGTYVLPFEVASLVLLSVLVGVVVLSRREPDAEGGRTE